jgi:hypothetical protein
MQNKQTKKKREREREKKAHLSRIFSYPSFMSTIFKKNVGNPV